ncbi:ISL3 family transposase [Sulfobacillus harzensis]|uniref:ISL3 family transposase n=1 Tax=Sulfobacillus harzensis TaxID=2729629 RepID=UPI001A9B7612|nr:ISL3 family transposase [Sulfobacillus harzensis]
MEQQITFDTPTWMGLDEIHLIRPRAVITNIRERTLVEILPQRNKETVLRYLSTLNDAQRVQVVTMDMWHPYREAVRTVLPQATIVVDKFHVVRMANAAVERVRKSLRDSLTPAQRRGLMHDRFVLLKRESDLRDQEALLLSLWVKNYPTLGLAYRLKENFFDIYEAPTKEQAQARFMAWEQALAPTVQDAFLDLRKAWHNWEPHILAYFDHRVTNAYTESLNSLIRIMNRVGRGYSFEALRAKMLFSEGTFKKQHIRPKFERRRDDDRSLSDRVSASMFGQGPVPRPAFYGRTPQETNYGVDMETLIRRIKHGEI